MVQEAARWQVGEVPNYAKVLLSLSFAPSVPRSTVGTFVHVMKSALGIGILSVPGAFKDGGLVFGVAGTFFLAMLCSHSAHILVSFPPS